MAPGRGFHGWTGGQRREAIPEKGKQGVDRGNEPHR